MDTMRIDFANLQYQYRLYKKEIDAAVQSVLDSSTYIMGPHIEQLEQELAAFTGASHCIACSSGTDALQLSLMALGIGPGDQVITTPFTFIATAEMIAHLKARPVFVDIDPETYNIDARKIEQAITGKTKAILPVSLYGQPADMEEINRLAKQHGLPVIEDAAQSFGAEYKSEKSCNLSTLGCTSFFPAKPLGCYGDGGAVFTSSLSLADTIRSLRVHGQSRHYEHQHIGLGARMDTLQAAVLLAKLPHYAREIVQRQEVARTYTRLLADALPTPLVRADRTSVWAQYSIQVPGREQVREHLSQAGIPTAVHYPKPVHLQECFAYLGYGPGDFPVAEEVSTRIMSLPMNPFLPAEDLEYVCTRLLEATE
ncbi:DegT/DnrJ/EryC1/StrS family aminotransferase [Desulfovermiculus halophilus]|uniref:DegT/DnrJ/EryC1/StrS family aminotransferase n=1 Tax=Desulfovermiculus halophilus TaxID=339722 RepID=UPI0024466AA7|nr:DegT/DnrJ/EryC1/StrS family aminotransferase [Desulfovermiculus halophilus]